MSSTQCPPAATSYPLSFDTVPHSFALSKKLSALESGKSELFAQNIGGGGPPLVRPIRNHRGKSDFYPLCFQGDTNHSSRKPFLFTSIQNHGGVGVRRRASAPNRPSPYLAITYIQPLQFHAITHSFAQLPHTIPPT